MPPVLLGRVTLCITRATNVHHESHQHLLAMLSPPLLGAQVSTTSAQHPVPPPVATCAGSICSVLPSPIMSVSVTSTLRVSQSTSRNGADPGTLWHRVTLMGGRSSAWAPGLHSPSRFLKIKDAIDALEEETFLTVILLLSLHATVALRKQCYNCL